jgi:hypothetical protein
VDIPLPSDALRMSEIEERKSVHVDALSPTTVPAEMSER